MNYEEIGKRFIDVCNKLNDMGVFYGKNYSGKYHEKYGHELHWFALHLDKHRGGFESIIYRECDNIRTIATENIDDNNPSLMIIELLENTFDILDDELGEEVNEINKSNATQNCKYCGNDLDEHHKIWCKNK